MIAETETILNAVPHGEGKHILMIDYDIYQRKFYREKPEEIFNLGLSIHEQLTTTLNAIERKRLNLFYRIICL